jgi:Domain of unknown function (DUF5666)
MMSKNRFFIAFAIVALLGAGVAFAASGDTQSATGTVISSSPTSLVVQTDNGQQTFVLDSTTQAPESLAAGDKVTVEYNSDDQGRLVATDVSAEDSSGTMGSQPATDMESESDQTQQPATSGYDQTAPQANDESAANSQPAAGGDQAGIDQNGQPPADQAPAATTGNNLPATASGLPLVGLLGLLALAGGVALRLTR